MDFDPFTGPGLAAWSPQTGCRETGLKKMGRGSAERSVHREESTGSKSGMLEEEEEVACREV